MSEKYSLNGGAVNLGEYGATKKRRNEDKINILAEEEVICVTFLFQVN